MLPRPKRKTIESKELISEDKKKMWHRNQEERKKEERQTLKDMEQVKKKKRNKSSTQGPKTKNKKLEQENREEGMKKQKDNVHCVLYKFCLSLSPLSCVVRARYNLFNYEKKLKSYDKARKFNCTCRYRLLLC